MGINRYSNGAWKEIGDLKAYRGGEWQTAELRRYTGTEWELLWPCHFSYTVQYPLSSYIVTSGYTTPYQITSDTLVTGPRSTNSAAYIRDSLLFFPIDQMKTDLAGSTLQKATLQLKRMPKLANDGEDTAYVCVGSALSGVDPAATGNTWSRKFTRLAGPNISFKRGQVKNVNLNLSGIKALLNGTADCLCLPTHSDYVYDKAGYGFYDPTQTVLTVTYYI